VRVLIFQKITQFNSHIFPSTKHNHYHIQFNAHNNANFPLPLPLGLVQLGYLKNLQRLWCNMEVVGFPQLGFQFCSNMRSTWKCLTWKGYLSFVNIYIYIYIYMFLLSVMCVEIWLEFALSKEVKQTFIHGVRDACSVTL
jgi:hypothetical protein